MKETIIKIHVSMEANLKYVRSLFSTTLSRFTDSLNSIPWIMGSRIHTPTPHCKEGYNHNLELKLAAILQYFQILELGN